MTKKQELGLIEARHLLRKHVVKSRVAGRAVTFKCKECGAVGPDVPDNITHLVLCRFAKLLMEMGETTIRLAEDSQKSSPVMTGKGSVTHDPVSAALECTS